MRLVKALVIPAALSALVLLSGCGDSGEDGGGGDETPAACRSGELDETKTASYARLNALKGSYVLNYQYDQDRFLSTGGTLSIDDGGAKSDTMVINSLSSPATSSGDEGYHYILATLYRNGGSGNSAICKHVPSCEWMDEKIAEEFWCVVPLSSYSDSYTFDIDVSAVEGGYIYVPTGNPWVTVDMASGEANATLTGTFTAN